MKKCPDFLRPVGRVVRTAAVWTGNKATRSAQASSPDRLWALTWFAAFSGAAIGLLWLLWIPLGLSPAGTLPWLTWGCLMFTLYVAIIAVPPMPRGADHERKPDAKREYKIAGATLFLATLSLAVGAGQLAHDYPKLYFPSWSVLLIVSAMAVIGWFTYYSRHIVTASDKSDPDPD